MNIDYICRTHDGRTAIISNHRTYMTDHSVTYVLDHILLIKLATTHGRLSATRKLTKWKRKVPIYVDRNHVFMVLKGLRCDESLIVNVKNVVSIEKKDGDSGIITFSKGHVLVFVSWPILCRQWERASVLIPLIERLENAFIGKTR